MTDNQGFNNKFNDGAVLQLLRAVEEKLSWNSADSWSSRDFERLSDLIFESTGARISVSTLKRLWGRTSQKSNPSSSTLDILVSFLGKESWQEYSRTRISGEVSSVADTKVPHAKSFWSRHLLLLTLGGLLLFAIAFFSKREPVRPVFDTGLVSFRIEKVTSGIPNTVIFHYDIGDQRVDSLELQQTWDENRRGWLDPSKDLVTATYFSPGYYTAKLVANGQVVASQHVYLPSDGLEFTTMHMQENDIRFLPNISFKFAQNELIYDHSALVSDVDPDLIGYQIVNLLPNPVIDKDSFSLKIVMRVLPALEDPCHAFSLIITGAEDVYNLMLGEAGCAGRFGIYWGGEMTTGKNNDLSALAVPIEKWTEIVVNKRGLSVEVRVDGRSSYFKDQISNIGLIGGVRIQSKSLIELKELSIQDQNQTLNLLGADVIND